MSLRRSLRSDDGSVPVEFLLVSVLLTLVTVSVVQLAFALYTRNTVLDAAAEGARYAALAGNTLEDGTLRTRNLIGAAVGLGYAQDVSADYSEYLGYRSVVVTVSAPLPLFGLLGPDRAMEVAGHAAVEQLEG
jgi:hypothetical protein